jgi:cyclic di-GMP phosphodiesterase Gmr
MEYEGTDAFLYARFGTTNPHWFVSIDSNALQVASGEGAVNFAVDLDAQKATEIRALSEMPAKLKLTLTIFDEKLQLYLFGRKVNKVEWRGLVSANSNLSLTEITADEEKDDPFDNVIRLLRKHRG